MVKLTTACRRDDPATIYKALRLDMARKLENTASGRDYAAIVKSFIEVQDRIAEMEERAAGSSRAEASALALARERHLKIVNG